MLLYNYICQFLVSIYKVTTKVYATYTLKLKKKNPILEFDAINNN